MILKFNNIIKQYYMKLIILIIYLQDELLKLTGVWTLPQVFLKGKFIGGHDALHNAHRCGVLEKVLKDANVI